MRTRVIGIAAVGLGLAGAAWFLAQRQDPQGSDRPRASLSVSEVLGGDPQGYSRALEPRPFVFPDDHGPHPSFRTEWWYLTGNLEGPEGEPYGFQFTLFRSALRPPGDSVEAVGVEDPSPWRSGQVYMGHLAVTNGANGTFTAFERFSREALGLAGAVARPFRVWLEDWELRGPGGPTGESFPMVLTATEDGTGLAVTLAPSKPLVLQGDQGLSRKGPEPGNASYYYSFTRLDSRGWILLAGDSVPVQGSAWMDREWSTSALSSGQVGWDWFALQLSDGWDLMYYRLRQADGSADPYSKGVLVDPAGRALPLNGGDVVVEVLEEWKSLVDGARYPSRWAISVPSVDLRLEIVPLVPDQELDLTFRYWEGAVSLSGTRAGTRVEGRGYVELTGYGGSRSQTQPGTVFRNQVPR